MTWLMVADDAPIEYLYTPLDASFSTVTGDWKPRDPI